MLKNLQIQNFRVFRDLRIDKLERINLFTGRNNSGKTSLLEALFLLSGRGSPNLVLVINSFRGIDSLAGELQTAGETIWKPLFSELNVGESVTIAGTHSSAGALILEISLDQLSTTEISLDDLESAPSFASDDRALALKFTGPEGSVEGRLTVVGTNFKIDNPNTNVPFRSIFVSSSVGNLKEDANRLGQLRKRKQGGLLLEALRTMEPRLQSIEDSFAIGSPMIWGDIGLPELVPLPVMGEGMSRVARLVLAISSAQNGVVLVDEIENGIHHSVLPDVWKVIEQAARDFDVQVFATTHSYECMRDAYKALGADGFVLHRLEATEDGNRCFTYKPSAVEAAIKHELEVR